MDRIDRISIGIVIIGFVILHLAGIVHRTELEKRIIVLEQKAGVK